MPLEEGFIELDMLQTAGTHTGPLSYGANTVPAEIEPPNVAPLLLTYHHAALTSVEIVSRANGVTFAEATGRGRST